MSAQTLQDYLELVEQLADVNVKNELEKLLYQQQRLDISEMLAKFGVVQSYDKFATLNTLETQKCKEYIPYIGAQYSESDLGLKLTVILADSPVQKAGLAVNDVIIAIDRIKAKSKTIQAIAEHLPENSDDAMSLFQR